MGLIDNRLTENCKNCGKEFRHYASAKRIFCSINCSKKYKKLNSSKLSTKESCANFRFKRMEDPIRYEKYREESRKRNAKYKLTPKGRYSDYKDGARVRSLSFEITYDEFLSFWQKPCVYCGAEIDRVGIDRIDSNIGYVKTNLVPCCKTCNIAKNNMSTQEFITWATKIADNFRGGNV